MLGIALTLSLGTLALPTGTRVYGNLDMHRDRDGSRCEMRLYGFPLRAVAQVDEPCAYALDSSNKPAGIEFVYTYIDVLKLAGNAGLWYLGLLLVAIFVRSSERLGAVREAI